MRIEDFNRNHIDVAKKIAIACYEQERLQVPALPYMDEIPELAHFTENGLGVAVSTAERLLGYLCAYAPRNDAFGTTNVKGTFSPLHASGIAPDIRGRDRDKIYSLLYQEAARKWVKEGIRSHAIALYSHDEDAIKSFFYNGFGLRCIDAIRSLTDIPERIDALLYSQAQFEYSEIPHNEWRLLLAEHNSLINHLGESPTFMHYKEMNEEELYNHAGEDIRYFGVRVSGSYIAYVKVGANGENFATEHSTMMNICGAYCSPQFRGTGVYHNLICYLMETLRSEGYQLLGVDCESFNPNARGFWLKNFTEYTKGMVRRIDEKAVDQLLHQ